MPVYVPGKGLASAKLMMVGEAPGDHEEEHGYPFAGPSGELLDFALNKAGHRRDEFYLTNIYKYKNFSQISKLIKKLDPITHAQLNSQISQFWEEVEAIRGAGWDRPTAHSAGHGIAIPSRLLEAYRIRRKA